MNINTFEADTDLLCTELHDLGLFLHGFEVLSRLDLLSLYPIRYIQVVRQMKTILMCIS